MPQNNLLDKLQKRDLIIVINNMHKMLMSSECGYWGNKALCDDVSIGDASILFNIGNACGDHCTMAELNMSNISINK